MDSGNRHPHNAARPFASRFVQALSKLEAMPRRSTSSPRICCTSEALNVGKIMKQRSPTISWLGVKFRSLPEPLGVVGGAVELRGGLVEFEGAVAGDGFGFGEQGGDLL